jgi:hypothetical protein
LWLAEITYASTWRAGYAFMLDVHSRVIEGWQNR